MGIQRPGLVLGSPLYANAVSRGQAHGLPGLPSDLEWSHRPRHIDYVPSRGAGRRRLHAVVERGLHYRESRCRFLHLLSDGRALDRIQSSRGGTAEGIRGKAPPAVVASINFWNVEFPLWDGCCPIVAGFSPEFTWEALGRQDASTDWGCGGFLFSPGLLLGYAHPWSAPERRDAFVTERESTGVFELLGARHWMERFAHRVRGRRLQLELDNSSSVQGLARAYSDKPVLLTLIQRFRRKSAIYHITLRVFHVLECFNSIADHLSHGRVRDAQWLARRVFGIDMVMVR